MKRKSAAFGARLQEPNSPTHWLTPLPFHFSAEVNFFPKKKKKTYSEAMYDISCDLIFILIFINSVQIKNVSIFL